MADLPRYQPTGRVFADVPQLDFANVRESFKASQGMSNALDRLSDFAGKYAAVQAEKQAEKFSVDNPITIEELQNAQKSGISAEDLIKASGGGTIWESTVRKMQGEQLRAQLEVYGQAALNDIQTQVEMRKLTDMGDIKQKFEAAIIGYEKPLAQINPESAVKYKQSMATTANAFYKQAAKTLAADYQNDEQVKSYVHFDNSIKAAKASIATITDSSMMDEVQGLMESRVYQQAREGGTVFAQKQVDEFRKQFQELKYNHLAVMASNPRFAKDAGEALTKLAKGDLKVDNENDYSQIYKNESPENQAKIRSYVRQQYIDINSTNNEIQKNKIEEQKAQANEIEIEYYNTKNPKLLKDLKAISIASGGKAITANAIEAIKKSGDEKDSDVQYSDNVIKMKDENRKGRYDSIEQVYARGEALGVSRKTINKYVMPSFLNKSDALVDSVLDDYARMSNPNGTKAAEVKKRIAAAQEVDNLFEAQSNKDPLKIKSKAEIAGELVDKKMKGNAANQSKVTELNALASKYKLPQFTAASSLDKLVEQDIDRKVKNKTDNAEIKRQLKALSGQ